MDFAFLEDDRMRRKESEKIDKYLNLVRELKKQNMKAMVILIVLHTLVSS